MKIKRLSCTQFAGVLDRDISFADGINVICGRNESGKSTMVNLLSRTLFQSARIDGRKDKDKEFCALYFPGSRRGSDVRGDFADGKLTFETEGGSYTLSKEWGADARCTLVTPDGSIRDQKKIDEILKNALLYGEGVYSDLLFSSQRSTDTALQALLDASKKTEAKAEITDAVSQAFAESGGISSDAIEQAIQARIDALAGKHWDTEHNGPARKTGGGRWSTGLGEILKSYYEAEDANAVLSEISRLEAEADRAAKDYAEKAAEANAAEAAFHRFNTFAGQLIAQNANQRELSRIQNDLQRLKAVLNDWPTLKNALTQAKTLQGEQASRDLLDKYEAAKKLMAEIRLHEAAVADRLCPADSEIRQVKQAQRTVSTLESKLCGMNLTAAIRMLGGNTVEVTSVRTGQRIDLSDGAAAIGEAVRITVPGVMEMQLSPANVDVAAVEAQIEENRRLTADILAKYRVNSAEELDDLARDIAAHNTKLETERARLAPVLGGTAYEALEAAAAEVPAELRSRSEIEADIKALCGSVELSRFITAKETVLDGYVSEYGSVNDLKAKAFDLSMELGRLQASAAETAEVPAEYVAISDPKAHLDTLQSVLKQKQGLSEAALTDKTAAASRLESYKETLRGDPAAEAERAARRLEEQRSLLAHWLHIQKVFRAQKGALNANPMQDIAESFSRYLGVISGGGVSSEFPEGDKLAVQVYSNDRLLDYHKLSEGTKETVSLAFRLAVLDHLFPEGGGVIVLDDPFTDMDEARTAQGCALLEECAKRHQVIFLTCREAYLELLGGTHIRF